MPSEDDLYREAFVELAPGASADDVGAWFTARGLNAAPAVSGVLVAGATSAFRTALGTEPPAHSATLPVPGEIADQVNSIALVPAKQPFRAEGSSS
jgi:hypothetical protein